MQYESEAREVTRWPDGVLITVLLMSSAMRWDFKCRLKLYRDEQSLMEVGMEFHVAGEL